MKNDQNDKRCPKCGNLQSVTNDLIDMIGKDGFKNLWVGKCCKCGLIWTFETGTIRKKNEE